MNREITYRILMIYNEPTSYIVALINLVIARWPGQVDVLFLEENLSQQWNISHDERWCVLPKGRFRRMRMIKQWMKQNHYRLIHLAGWGHPWMLFCLFSARVKRIPVSVESDTPLFSQAMPYWKRLVKRLIYPILFRQFNLFLPGGKRQAQYFKYYGVDDKKIIPVNMTIDVVAIQKHIQVLTHQDRQKIRRQYRIPEESVVFLFVGRFAAYKGIPDLLSAFLSVQSEKAILFFVGDGEYRTVIERSLIQDSRIRYAGRLSGAALIEVYYASDVLVLPSHREPWGLVVNEAMAVGLPVIVSDCAGCVDDLLMNRQTGLVIKTESVIELQAAMERLMDAQQRTVMRKHVLSLIQEWTLEQEAEKICQAWQQHLA